MRLTRGVGWPYLGGMDGVNLKKKDFKTSSYNTKK